MQTLTERVFLLSPPGGLFDSAVIRNLFPESTEGALKAQVNRALKNREIFRLKSGLYCLAQEYRNSELHPFSIAGMLYSPSYISLESALSYHSLIPEMVYDVTSVSALRSRSYETVIGNFSFTKIPTNNFKANVSAERFNDNGWAFIAGPLRAIADLVYLRKEITWQTDRLGFLLDSLRMEEEELLQISFDPYEDVYNSIRNKRTKAYLSGLKTELQK